MPNHSSVATGGDGVLGDPTPPDPVSIEGVLQRLGTLKKQLAELETDTRAWLKAREEGWLTTREFARLAGLLPKTVSNYASAGKYRYSKQMDNGQWLIFYTELEAHQPTTDP